MLQSRIILRSRFGTPYKAKARSGYGSASKSNFRICELQKGATEGHRGVKALKMQPWSVFRPAVADLHQLGEEQDEDADPNPHESEKWDPGPQNRVLDPQHRFNL